MESTYLETLRHDFRQNCSSYRYAFLKDGQLHVQGINGSVTSLSLEATEGRNTEIMLGQGPNSNSVDSIKGEKVKACLDIFTLISYRATHESRSGFSSVA